jgi:serine phosphatase RsbU (regulator of sigma subunit)
MGIIEESPRFATVRALQPTRLLRLLDKDVVAVLLQQPLLLFQGVRVLSSRLREADLQMIADLQRKNQELRRAYRELQEAQAALVEKERLERELELARELQQSILSREFPCVTGLSYAARNRPARQVGGDFYDVIRLRGGRVGLVMADVSDKGMPAALYMALTHSLIRAEAMRSSSPRRVLLRVHELLMEISHADMFVTVFYGVLDPAEGALRYARAGHDRPLLVHPCTGECRFLTGDGMLLGMLERVELEEVTVSFHPGDVLVLYTDGITEANSPAGEFFGVERLREVVCTAGALSASDLCDYVFEEVDRFQTGAGEHGHAIPQHDDMALLVVKAEAQE